MAKIWKVAHVKMDIFSVKVLIIIIMVTMVKLNRVMRWAKHFMQIISLNSHKSSMW